MNSVIEKTRKTKLKHEDFAYYLKQFAYQSRHAKKMARLIKRASKNLTQQEIEESIVMQPIYSIDDHVEFVVLGAFTDEGVITTIEFDSRACVFMYVVKSTYGDYPYRIAEKAILGKI